MDLQSNGLHGAYTRGELVRLLGARSVHAAVADGSLTTFAGNVLVDPRRAAKFRTRAAAALLFGGDLAVLHGYSALAMHGCDAAEIAPIHLLVPYQRKARTRPWVRVHYGSYVEQDVLEIDGLRCQVLDLAVSEVLCRSRRPDAIACADQALASLPVDEQAEFRAWVAARIQARPDPRGRRRSQVLLDLATGLSESPAESITLLNIYDSGLPVPEQQVAVSDVDGRERYRLDFAWPEVRIAVEYDGYAAHEGRQEFDQARAEDLRRRGWIVIRSDARDLADPSRLVAAIRAAFRQRGLAA